MLAPPGLVPAAGAERRARALPTKMDRNRVGGDATALNGGDEMQQSRTPQPLKNVVPTVAVVLDTSARLRFIRHDTRTPIGVKRSLPI